MLVRREKYDVLKRRENMICTGYTVPISRMFLKALRSVDANLVMAIYPHLFGKTRVPNSPNVQVFWTESETEEA